MRPETEYNCSSILPYLYLFVCTSCTSVRLQQNTFIHMYVHTCRYSWMEIQTNWTAAKIWIRPKIFNCKSFDSYGSGSRRLRRSPSFWHKFRHVSRLRDAGAFSRKSEKRTFPRKADLHSISRTRYLTINTFSVRFSTVRRFHTFVKIRYSPVQNFCEFSWEKSNSRVLGFGVVFASWKIRLLKNVFKFF